MSRRTDELTPEAREERERCQQIAESVFISSRNWLEGGGPWTPTDRAAWEARMRAASDILTSIRLGVEP